MSSSAKADDPVITDVSDQSRSFMEPMMPATDPKRSIELLRSLRELGFTDAAFSRLHHRRLQGQSVTIDRHINYCEDIGNFHNDGENALVQRRLEIVLKVYQAGGFKRAREEIFTALADAAFYELPSGFG
jgi:hypothetical protein